MDTIQLSQQHDELMQVARELGRAVASVSPQPVGPVRWQLARMLIAHLALEDRIFYPSLERHGDAQARDTAARFLREMGGLSAAFSTYMSQWSDDRIARDWSGFCVATQGILSALQNRVEREERLLYPLASRIAPARRLSA